MTAPVAVGGFDVTAEAIVRYAGASGDFTPIHYDADVLAAAGYSRFFAMGMLTAGHLGSLLCRTFGDEAVTDLRVRFRARCWSGAPVELAIFAIPGEQPTGPDLANTRRVRLEATQAGILIVDGEAVVQPVAAAVGTA